MYLCTILAIGKYTIDTANSQLYVNIPREDSVLSLLISHFDLNFEELPAEAGNR